MNAFIDDDTEANIFAMELLMPESFVRAEVAKMGGKIDLTVEDDVKKLAKKFGVTQAMMAFRLGELFNSKQRLSP